MNHEDNRDLEEIRAALRAALPPTNTELRHDLWPAMLRRLEPAPQRVPWYDWVLVAAIVAVSLVVPKFILVLSYHI
jgi:hypothetical protein